jgi:hypothetical protein
MKKKVTVDATREDVLVIDGKKYHARVFDVNGIKLELYTVGALAKALGRWIGTIQDWEKDGLIPKPIFKVTGNTHVERLRWYSRQQIVNIYQVSNRFPFTAGRPHLKDVFFTAINKVFDEGEIINVGELEIKSRSIPAARPVGEKRTGAATARTAAAGGTVSRSAPPTAPIATTTGAGATATQSQSERRGTVAAPFGRTPASRGNDSERVGDSSEPTQSPDTRSSGHAEYPPQYTHTQRVNYRRRPARSV